MDASNEEKALRIAVIGDVHDKWDEQDAIALQSLPVDLALFVGDFGNESVEVVRSIAAVDVPKAAIFGNHDAWFSASSWGRKKCPYDRTKEDRVQQQLDLMGDAHVGYRKLDFAELGLTVVGGRPFSWGGSDWKNKTFHRDRFGIRNFEESEARIKQSVDEAAHDTVIFIGHCGPVGLGEHPEAPCGKDWKTPGGDHGDPDLAAAIAYAQTSGKNVPLVTFGHMHHTLRHRKDVLRERLSVDDHGTIYLNAACVPRIVTTESSCLRNFSLVTFKQGQVQQASLVWVDQSLAIASEEVLWSTAIASDTLSVPV